jgi:alpha-galactosidase
VIAPRIAIIGAGGFVFPLALIRDMLSFPALRDAEIRLYDIDLGAAAHTARLAARLAERHDLAPRLTVGAERDEALAGADVVICTFQVGGLEAYGLDVEIPREFGVDQPVGDTLGPGGVFRGLRTIPVLRGLAADMRRLCPGALMLQYANPMAINCWAADRLGVEGVGLCHSVQHTSAMIAAELGLDQARLDFDCAGINHMAWFTRLRDRETDRDLLDELRAVMTERHRDGGPGGQGAGASVYEGAQERVRTELMDLAGYFHTESSHHASEYWPWFRGSPARTADYIPQRWDYYESCRTGHHPAAADAIAEGPLRAGVEYAAPIIDSLVTGIPRIIHGNVRNAGCIPNLPHDACVEVPCSVDRAGVRPARFGPLPSACAALNAVSVNVQRLVVEAGLSGDAALVRAALALDPLTGAVLSLPEIRRLSDRMLVTQRQWLPQFTPVSSR